jgi:hypothetical protein
MIKPTLILLLVLSNSAPSALGLNTFNQGQERLAGYLDQLRSPNPEDRENAARGILQSKSDIKDRRDLVNAIENIARDFIAVKERAGSAKTAISLLGDLQSVDSIPFLLENLTFHVFYKEAKRAQDIGDAHPCAGALIAIGGPSLDPIISKAEETDDELTIRIASFVVMRILRGEASSYIQERVESQSVEVIQRRLLRMKHKIDLWRSTLKGID